MRGGADVIALLDPLRDISLLAILVRMVLSFICGGLIGIEREFKRRVIVFLRKTHHRLRFVLIHFAT